MVTAGILPFRENSHGRTGNRTRDLTISSQRLWPLDHEAGHYCKCKPLDAEFSRNPLSNFGYKICGPGDTSSLLCINFMHFLYGTCKSSSLQSTLIFFPLTAIMVWNSAGEFIMLLTSMRSENNWIHKANERDIPVPWVASTVVSRTHNLKCLWLMAEAFSQEIKAKHINEITFIFSFSYIKRRSN